MAAKLLHLLADDNPDLQKQIGCMNGILQIFDRHQMGRRLNGHSHKGLLPPGNSQYSSASVDADSNNAYNQDAMERIGNKDSNDKRVPTESSKAYFPSSFSPSFSSIDRGKVGHLDPSSLERIIVPETPLRDPVLAQPIASPKLGRLSLDLRDVVKDSMHRESRGSTCQVSKHNDSPRPLQLSKSFNRSSGVGMNGKIDLPGDLKESLKLLARLREAPWYETKDGYSLSTSRDAPRYSYDGREMNHLSSESRDFCSSNQRIKDLPRLSLDSRESSMRASGYDLNLAYLSKNAENGDAWFNERASYAQKISRPPNVVAKLMGLDTLPDNKPSRESQLRPTKVASLEDHGCSIRAKSSDVCRPIRLPSSPRSSRKEPTSPRWKNGDMRPISSSRCPIEPAPWKLKSPERVSNFYPSVYSEVEKRLKDMEFEQSGNDLRALKQILEAMEAKGLLGTAKEEQNLVLRTKREDEQEFKGSNRNSGHISASEPQRKRAGVSVIRRPGSSNACESSTSDISGLVKYSLNQRVTKTQTPKESCRDHSASTSTRRVSSHRNLRVGQNSAKAQPASRDSNVSFSKNLGSISPRLQKKLEFDKRSTTPTPDSGRSRRQSYRQVTESGGSPGGRRRAKSSIVLQNDVEATSNERSVETSECQIPSTEAFKCSDISEIRTNSSSRSSEGDIVEELPAFGPEHPSPISVLDASVYGEDSPSPVKQTSHNLGIGAKTSDGDHVEGEWESVNNLSANHDIGSGFTSEINIKKSGNVDNLMEKLTQLNSNPVHRYVSEILSASGLLHSDLNSAFSTFQLHQSGHLINPELFFVLEQTQSSSFLSTKSDKLHRKLIFDAVNEILALKLTSVKRQPIEPWLNSCKLAKKTLNSQKLLREMCEEIEQLEASERRELTWVGVEGDGLRSILCEDLMYRSDGWTEFQSDASGVVLDVERLIFRDLVDEVVIGEVSGLRGMPRKQCRRLILK